MIVYTYCGITFSSNQNFSFFEISEDAAMVSLEIIDKDINFKNKDFVFKKDEKYFVNFSPIGYYEITSKTIVAHFDDHEFVKATICNIPFSILAILNGVLPIHCSSVISNSDNQAILFMGKKGVGKTTIAYLLNKHFNYQLLGDDMVAIKQEDNYLMLYCGTTQIKLCEDLWNAENISQPKNEVYNNWKKFYYTPSHSKSRLSKYIVNRAFLLNRGNTFAVSSTKNFNEVYILNNIVGINYIGDVLSNEIIHLIKKYINKTNFLIKTLEIPDNIDNLRHKLSEFNRIIC